MITAKVANWAAKSEEPIQEKVEPKKEHKRRKPFPEKAKCTNLYMQAYHSLNDENNMFPNA
jgi:hypothetical protein